MSSPSDERLMNVLGQAQQNLIKAKDPTPCVMISEENWKAIIETLQGQLEAENRLGELLRKLPTDQQLVDFLNQMKDIHIYHEGEWMKELESEAKKMQTDSEKWSTEMETEYQSQAGKLNEQYATELANTKETLKKEMQEYSDKLYHRILLPCLLMTLLSAVLVLLEICKV